MKPCLNLTLKSCTSSLVYLVRSGTCIEYIAIHTALTMPKIISSKSWLLKLFLTHLLETSDMKKKTSSSTVINLASSGTISRCLFYLGVHTLYHYFNQGHLDFNFKYIITIFELTFPQSEMNNSHICLISVTP